MDWFKLFLVNKAILTKPNAMHNFVGNIYKRPNMNILLTLLPDLIKRGFGILKDKQRVKAAVVEAALINREAKVQSQIKSIERGELSDIELDSQARQQAGWMDDVSFFVFLLPALLAFYPPALPHIAAGFSALEKMPPWYQYALGMMLISVWGYRKLVGPIIQSVVKSYLGKARA